MYADRLLGRTINFDSGSITIESLLSRTSCSSIYLGNQQGTQFALKSTTIYMSHFQEVFLKESSVLRQLGTHPNIISLYDCILLQELPQIGIIKLEYCSRGNLCKLMETQNLTDDQILFVLKDIISALIKLQENGIIHRDISPKNVLVTNDFRFKLCDFGSCLKFEEAKAAPAMAIVLGNVEKFTHPDYRPPDFQNELDLGKMDIWGLGCLLHFMMYREMPFGNKIENIDKPDRSELLREILNLCLEPTPKERISPRLLLNMINNWKIPFDLAFSSGSNNQKIVYFSLKSSIKYCLENLFIPTENPPDLFLLHKVFLSAYTKPDSISKFFNSLKNIDNSLTIIAIKELVVLHRYMISGPIEATINNQSSKEILSGLLGKWTNKQKDARDVYHCDYYCGLVRQMCRVLMEKIEIHQQTGSPGNWKKNIQSQHIHGVLEYLAKLIRVCEGLYFGVTNLNRIMNFLTMQLIEECQRLSAIINMSLKPIAEQHPIEVNTYMQLFQRIANLTNQKSTDFLQAPKQEIRKIHSQTSKSPPMIIPQNPQMNQNQMIPNNLSPARPQVNLMIPDQIPAFPSTPLIQNQKPSIVETRWVIKPEELKLEKILGSGASCTVYKGIFKKTPVAIKMIKTVPGGSLEKEFEREVTAMMLLRHPNLILFMGACSEPQMIIVSEFCGGDTLFKLLHERKNIMLTWKQKLKILRDVARGMHYLHVNDPPLLHRDLKSLNLLLLEEVNSPNDKIQIKITDFGVTRMYDNAEKMTGQMGTCHWMAPEVINNQPYALSADVYSFAIVMWEVAAREIPYKDVNPMAIPVKVLRGERPNLSGIPSTCPEMIKDIIRAAWDANPARRPTFAQIIDALDQLDAETP